MYQLLHQDKMDQGFSQEGVHLFLRIKSKIPYNVSEMMLRLRTRSYSGFAITYLDRDYICGELPHQMMPQLYLLIP